jgi:5-methylcytosine-specific restriction endonuclease McrA
MPTQRTQHNAPRPAVGRPSARARAARDARLAGATWRELAERFGYAHDRSVRTSVLSVARDDDERARLIAAMPRPAPSWRQDNGNGYVRMPAPARHPLAHLDGSMYEHRFVLYEALGPGPHPCEYCGASLDWPQIHVDHRNADRADNRLENLAVACARCNSPQVARDYPSEDELLVEAWQRGDLDVGEEES